MRKVAHLPLAEDIPIAFNSCRKGPRGISWRDDRPAELTWTEAQVGNHLLRAQSREPMLCAGHGVHVC